MRIEKRKFGGKIYKYAGWVSTKKDANASVRMIKKDGYEFTKITTGKSPLDGKSGYVIWWRDI